jgi:virulence-associated protein VagC
MDTRTTTLCRANGGQSVRIPDALAFPDEVEEVEVCALNDGEILQRPRTRLEPSGFMALADLADACTRSPDGDFMRGVDDPPPEDRALF